MWSQICSLLHWWFREAETWEVGRHACDFPLPSSQIQSSWNLRRHWPRAVCLIFTCPPSYAPRSDWTVPRCTLICVPRYFCTCHAPARRILGIPLTYPFSLQSSKSLFSDIPISTTPCSMASHLWFPITLYHLFGYWSSVVYWFLKTDLVYCCKCLYLHIVSTKGQWRSWR